jgi:hypothetical protein
VGGCGLFCVELDGVEDGFEAVADGIEFLGGHIFYIAYFAAAEVVDDEVEAVAGPVVEGGVGLVAGFGANAAVLIVAVVEGDTADLGVGDGPGGTCRCLEAAGAIGETGSDAGVEESPAEGGSGKRVEGDAGYGADLRAAGGGAGIEMEGADFAVPVGEIPACGEMEGDAVAGVVNSAGCGDGGIGYGCGRFGHGNGPDFGSWELGAVVLRHGGDGEDRYEYN